LQPHTKKGRARWQARPQPTIHGNCESWNPIVGKKSGRPTRFLSVRRCCSQATHGYQQVTIGLSTNDGRAGAPHRRSGIAIDLFFSM
jgi:hypothetical protein